MYRQLALENKDNQQSWKLKKVATFESTTEINTRATSTSLPTRHIAHPYDEFKMDQFQRQEQEKHRLSLRSKFIEGNSNTIGNSLDRYSMPVSERLSSPPNQHQRPPRPTRAAPAAANSRRRKTHPWQSDVQLNRFSGGGGKSGPPPKPLTGTQKSTLGWKQRMQERRAVFGNVAVMEHNEDNMSVATSSRDEEDCESGHFDNYEGEESQSEEEEEKDPETIHNEAVELLRSKGFQGILKQQYDDDLESVGPTSSVQKASASKATPTSATPFKGQRQKLKLDEIQSLRRKILLQKDKDPSSRRESLSPLSVDGDRKDDEDEPYDQKSGASTPSSSSESPLAKKKTLELSEEDNVQLPSAALDENSDTVKAWRVMKQLKLRLQDVFTDDHVVIEAFGRQGQISPSSMRIVVDEMAFSRHKLRDAVERRVSQVYTGDHHVVCNGKVLPREIDQLNEASDDQLDDTDKNNNEPNNSCQSESVEFATEEASSKHKSLEQRERLSDSFQAFEAILKARQASALAEDDEWTECSMTVADPATSIRDSVGMLPNLQNNNCSNAEDEQSVYTEVTLQTNNDALSLGSTKEESGCQEDRRCTIKMSNLTQPCDNDDEFEECTVLDEDVDPPTTPTFSNLPFRMPGQPQLPIQCLRKAPEDDESYMEFTVQDSVPDDSPPPPQCYQGQSSRDDQSYMEVTVRDDDGGPDLTSPHMASLLSSRMFADMQLPESLRQQQPDQSRTFEEENNDSYPTITIDDTDDDMTQITFDHTMDEAGFAQEGHYHATQYLNNSSTHTTSSRRGSTGGSSHKSTINDVPDFPSVIGSQHTEQTRDTTVSDDASSNHGSFKSCASTESNQFVAELLRRDIWSPDPTVVQTALEKLGQEASKGYNERANIVRYGGLLAILRAMELKPDQGQIQMQACVALEAMAVDSANQIAIREVGCFSAISNAMLSHAVDIDVQCSASSALSTLTRPREDGSTSSAEDPSPNDRVVQALVNSMKLHVDNAEVQSNAFMALANLCVDNKDRLRELKKMNGLAAMTTALQVPWENQTDQHEAISTLSILLRSMTDLDK